MAFAVRLSGIVHLRDGQQVVEFCICQAALGKEPVVEEVVVIFRGLPECQCSIVRIGGCLAVELHVVCLHLGAFVPI